MFKVRGFTVCRIVLYQKESLAPRRPLAQCSNKLKFAIPFFRAWLSLLEGGLQRPTPPQPCLAAKSDTTGPLCALVQRRGMASSEAVNLADMRMGYNAEGKEAFDVTQLVATEPFANFRNWFEAVRESKAVLEPNAMCLATASKDGLPSARMVLLKGYDASGFKFFTNYDSRKGCELMDNPNAALLFYWDKLHKQVRVEGRVVRLSEAESVEYFQSRPHGSQLSAIVSKQSSRIASRQMLVEGVNALQAVHKDETLPLPKPPHWGGYLLVPHCFEFWQGNIDRLHDRIVFRRPAAGEKVDPAVTHEGTDGWVYERLSP